MANKDGTSVNHCITCGSVLYFDRILNKYVCQECKTRDRIMYDKLFDRCEIMPLVFREVPSGNKVRSVEIATFEQTWSDTACGLAVNSNYMAGQAFTSAYTTIVTVPYCESDTSEEQVLYVVFFDGQFAYSLDAKSNIDAFKKDWEQKILLPVYAAKEKYNLKRIRGEE